MSDVTQFYYQLMHNGVNSFLKDKIYASSIPRSNYSIIMLWQIDNEHVMRTFFQKLIHEKGFFHEIEIKNSPSEIS